VTPPVEEQVVPPAEEQIIPPADETTETTSQETPAEENTGEQISNPEEVPPAEGTPGEEGESGVDGEDGIPDEDAEPELTNEEEDVLDNASSTDDGNSSSTNEGVGVGESGEDGEDGANGDDGGSNGGGLPAIIDTGDAAAAANILNMVNLNIVDSEGWVNFMNLFGGLLGDVDLSDVTFPESDRCQSDECEAARLEGRRNFENENDGEIDNNVNVGAGTGGNEITGTGEIYTGDAAAAANVVNVLNTNIIRSNYLILALNSFGNFDGDLVLPGASFFEQLFGGRGEPRSEQTIPPCEQTLEIENDNQAEVSNTGDTVAETGGNEVEDGDGAVIETGNADALSNTANLVNSNYYNSSPVYILVRVTGRWNGDVFSVPPGLKWEETPMGILITSDDDADGGVLPDVEPEAELVEGEVEEVSGTETNEEGIEFGHGARPCESSDLIQNTNRARVNNNVNVLALTGENRINNGGGSYIGTGNAFAASNVFNVVNTNIVGSNWILALVNIFGDWDGNLAFGRPDLWIGTRAAASTNPLVAGGSVTYTIDVTNHGDATATNVRVRSGSDPHERVKQNQTPDNLFVTAFSGLFSDDSEDDKNVVWEIPSLAPGESRTLSYTSQVTDNPPGGLSSFDTITTVASTETDASETDNTDKLTLMLQGATTGGGGGQVYVSGFGGGYGKPKLEISKTSNAGPIVNPSSTVSYKIIVENTFGDLAREAGVVDELRDPNGNLVAENIWDLGTIYSGEEIVIDYDTTFSATAPFGTYVNVAKLYAKNDFGQVLETVIASSSIVIGVGVPVGPMGTESASEDGDNESDSDDFSLSLFKPEIAMASPEPLPILEKAEYQDQDSGLASIFSLFPWLGSNCFFLLILVILLALYVWWRTRRKKDSSQ
ncbi:MAG: hypothetical protein AAB787_02090, partial [Patescibacteria group bacterium]